jgi:hypothetical protein
MLRACAAAVLVAAGAIWVLSGTQREQPVLSAATREPMRVLEASVAARPTDGVATRALAQEYLYAYQPGLAIVLMASAPPSVRNDVPTMHMVARALIDQGRNNEAFDFENRVIGACSGLTEGSATPPGCDPVLLVSAMRRADILRELLSLGVEDARAQPEASLVAYQNATREARVTLQ